MKFTADTRELSQVAEIVRKATTVKSDLQALDCILLRAENNELILTGYNLTIGIRANIKARVHEEGTVAIEARTFADIIKNLQGLDVMVNADGTKVEIVSGDSLFNLMGLSAEEFPELPEVKEEESFTLDRDVLTSAIRQTVFSAAKTNTNKVVHTGVKFEGFGGKLRFVSTDGFRLSYRETAFDGELDFVVPAKALYEVVKIVSQSDENVRICKATKHISFKSVNYTLISRLLEGKFLKYQSAFDGYKPTSVKVNTSALQEALSRVSIIVSDKLASPIKAVFSDNSIQLEVTTATGKAEERLDAKIEGEEVTIGFNSAFFNEALKAIEEEEVVIKLNDAVSPIIFQPVKGEHFKYLVLPVRLKK